MFLSGTITSVDRNGASIEIQSCAECGGYERCGIHSACIFSQYNAAKPGALSTAFYARAKGKEKVTRFRGRAVAIERKGGKEILRIEFGGLPSWTMQNIDALAARQAIVS